MANFVLKDINGNEATYARDKIKVDTADGGTQIFSEGEAVENVPITLYLANGDQTITAPDGTLVKSVIILKPENLKPENIAKDEEIAGVVGTLSGCDFDFKDENLKYFAYSIDITEKTITLCDIFHAVIYANTGSYDVTIPEKIGGYSVIIASEVI